MSLDVKDMVAFPVYWCSICRQYTVHLLLHAITEGLKRAIARCQVCDQTHVIKLDEGVDA